MVAETGAGPVAELGVLWGPAPIPGACQEHVVWMYCHGMCCWGDMF